MADRQRTGQRGRVRPRALGLASLLLALAHLQPLAPPATAAPAADFSAVTTLAAARRLVREGELVAIHLFPLELGGPDDRENIVYVTPEAARARAGAVAALRGRIERGLVDGLEVQADYKGDSVVPSRIVMIPSRGGTRQRSELAIEVW